MLNNSTILNDSVIASNFYEPMGCREIGGES